jgi:hypothetical protein
MSKPLKNNTYSLYIYTHIILYNIYIYIKIAQEIWRFKKTQHGGSSDLLSGCGAAHGAPQGLEPLTVKISGNSLRKLFEKKNKKNTCNSSTWFRFPKL